jgi:hypothetical protein
MKWAHLASLLRASQAAAVKVTCCEGARPPLASIELTPHLPPPHRTPPRARSLIAGFVVEYGSSQIDLSIRGQVERVAESLTREMTAAV